MRHLLFFSLELDITKDMANCNVNPLIVELSIRTLFYIRARKYLFLVYPFYYNKIYLFQNNVLIDFYTHYFELY